MLEGKEYERVIDYGGIWIKTGRHLWHIELSCCKTYFATQTKGQNRFFLGGHGECH